MSRQKTKSELELDRQIDRQLAVARKMGWVPDQVQFSESPATFQMSDIHISDAAADAVVDEVLASLGKAGAKSNMQQLSDHSPMSDDQIVDEILRDLGH